MLQFPITSFFNMTFAKEKKKLEKKNFFNFFKPITHVISLQRKELFKNALKHLHMGF